MLAELHEKNEQLKALCSKHHVSSLAVFGSAAGHTFDPARSDIDFVVDFKRDLTAAQYADAFFSLRVDLEALFGRSIDLITRRSITNPFFKAQVLEQARQLYAA